MVLRCCEGSAPLLQRGDAGSAPAHTVEAYLALGRGGKNGRFPGWPTLRPFLVLGCTCYGGGPVFLILQPTFFDDKLLVEWFADAPEANARWQLTLVSMGFFALWGIGVLVLGSFADRRGRRLALVLTMITTCALAFACALAPSFPVYALCRVLLGAPSGAAGGLTWMLCVEWALPRDNALLSSGLMVLWSLSAAAFAGLMAACDALSMHWRVVEALLALSNGAALLLAPMLLESPRYYLAHGCDAEGAEGVLILVARASLLRPPLRGRAGRWCGRRVAEAEAVLVRACAASGIAIPPGSSLRGGPALGAGVESGAVAEGGEASPVAGGDVAAGGDAAAGDCEAAGGEAAGGGEVGRGKPHAVPASASACDAPPTAGDPLVPSLEAPSTEEGSRAIAEARLVEATPHGARAAGTCRELLHPRTCLRLLLVAFLWIACSQLFYGLDFAVAECADNCNRYLHSAATSLVDVPGYLLGSMLADTRLGRRLTSSLSLVVGGGCLLLTSRLPSGSSAMSEVLVLTGKLCAAAAFIQAYLFPVEIFPTHIRGTAIGIANLASRGCTVFAPVAATAPAQIVQASLGVVGILAGLSTLLLPESQRSSRLEG